MRRLVFICIMLLSTSLFSQTAIYTDEDGDGIVEYVLKSDEGKVIETGYYLNWKMHGTWTSYYDSGEKHTIARFRNGERHGKWVFFDRQGRLTFSVTYDKNKKIMATQNRYVLN